MTDKNLTSRRSFLKSGAIVGVPLAVVGAPAAASVMADDGSRLRLTRIEDERAIEALNRSFLRRFNAGGATGEFFAGGKVSNLAEGVIRVALDATAEPEHFSVSEDGLQASARFACTAEFEHELEGEGTFVEMARLQGNGPVRLSEARSFVANYVRRGDAWVIERIELA